MSGGLCLYSSTLQGHKTPQVSHSNPWHANNHSLLKFINLNYPWPANYKRPTIQFTHFLRQLGKFWKSHLGIAEGISPTPEIFKREML